MKLDGSVSKFSHKSQDSHAIANQIVVILSFAAASISLWPANLLQSLLRTGFTSVPDVWFYCSLPIFQNRERASANCTSNFVSSFRGYLLWENTFLNLINRFVFLYISQQEIYNLYYFIILYYYYFNLYYIILKYKTKIRNIHQLRLIYIVRLKNIYSKIFKI